MSIRASMAALADALAKEHAELDVTLASLGALEALMKGKPVTEATTRAWGAYLGECMRRARPAEVSWVTYDEAAATERTIAAMVRDYDIEAILRVGAMHWFPLAKVEKFQRNGAEDSVIAFAGVALDYLPDPDAVARDRARHAENSAASLELGKRFAAAPTAAALLELQRGVRIGPASEPRNAETVRGMGLPVAALAALLDEPAVGRGTARTDPGRVAAWWLAALAIHRIASIPDLPPRASAVARENHAYARCYADLRAGETAQTVAAGESTDKAQRNGAFAALATLANDWSMGRAYPAVPFGAFAPFVVAGLAPRSPHLASALDVVWTWTHRRAHTREIAPAIPAVQTLVLPTTNAKPKPRERAERILDTYALSIVHGHTPDDPRVAALVDAVRARVAARSAT